MPTNKNLRIALKNSALLVTKRLRYPSAIIIIPIDNDGVVSGWHAEKLICMP
jgi:hypothetical protein